MKKFTGLLSLIASIVSAVLSIVLFNMETGSYESPLYYGGDAYTGIQQAAAQSANNTIALAEICSTGFGAICLIAAFAFFMLALLLFSSKNQKNKKPQYAPPAPPLNNPVMYPSVPFEQERAMNHAPVQTGTPPHYNPPQDIPPQNTNNPYVFHRT